MNNQLKVDVSEKAGKNATLTIQMRDQEIVNMLFESDEVRGGKTVRVAYFAKVNTIEIKDK